ncbi:FxsA family protein [Billgrantia sp. LNSP4103-1]|uniref:FxsA family protein n=1 Tax=Billgrantia sp. LNSP4103-1 TaxID=3410266 RepID=UPI00403F46B3
MPLLLLISLFTLLDFVVLFSIGSQIGLLATLLLVLATGFIGLHLIRREGTATLARAQQRLAQGELPSDELLTGAALIFGGALLLAPGFLSDALGLLCIVPTARRWVARGLARLNLRLQGSPRHGPSGQPDDWQQARPNGKHAYEADSHETGQQRDGNEERPLEGDFISRDEPRR